jgi:hypothetical protein
MFESQSIPFFQRAAFEVKNSRKPIAKQRQPEVDIADIALFISIKLAKLGYFSGDPSLILEAPVDMVLAILAYENFDSDLNTAYNQIMKEDTP